MAGTFRAGKSGRVTIGLEPAAQHLALQEWAVTGRGADLDTTNFESQGLEEGLIGIVGADWSVRGNWDSAMNPMADPPGLFPRDNGTNMSLITNIGDADGYVFPYWRCLNSRITTTANGMVAFDADGKSQGPFNTPGFAGTTLEALSRGKVGGPVQSQPVLGEWETRPVPVPSEARAEAKPEAKGKAK
jgi:hypothetical protein